MKVIKFFATLSLLLAAFACTPTTTRILAPTIEPSPTATKRLTPLPAVMTRNSARATTAAIPTPTRFFVWGTASDYCEDFISEILNNDNVVFQNPKNISRFNREYIDHDKVYIEAWYDGGSGRKWYSCLVNFHSLKEFDIALTDQESGEDFADTNRRP